MIRSSRHQSVGHTLIELSVAMSLGSTLMILAIGAIHRSMSWSTLNRQRSNHLRSIDRMAIQFRQDVHLAHEWTRRDPEAAELRMHDGSTITYRWADNALIRDHQLETNRHQERYELMPGASIQMQTLDTPPRASLTVIVNPEHLGPHDYYEGRLDCHVQAVIGRIASKSQSPVGQGGLNQ